MTLSDKEIQSLQRTTKENVRHGEGYVFNAGTRNNPAYYKIIHRVDDTTQAMAVVPVDDLAGHNPNYQETTIVIGGTQPVFGSTGEILTPYFWEKKKDRVTSSFNAFTASGFFGPGKGHLTAQTSDIDKFYLETFEKVKSQDEKAFISNMSGHSQSGPGTAKTAAKYAILQGRPIKVTNFMDFAAQKAVETGAFTKEELAYLNKNATIYRDSRGDIVFLDVNGGNVPYGKIMRFEVEEGQDGHSPRTPVMKGDKLDVDYYYRKNLFASGMTEKQVRKVIEAKIKDIESGKNKDFLPNINPNYYLMLYKKMYGDFAPELSNQEQLSINRQLIDKLHASLRTSSGDKTISLREELVRTSAQTAQLQAEVYEQEIKDKLASAKSKVEEHISELSKAAYTLAHNLSAGEVEDLLSELTLSKAWNGGTEASTFASASAYTAKMTEIAGNLNKAADNIVAIDQKGAQIFTNK